MSFQELASAILLKYIVYPVYYALGSGPVVGYPVRDQEAEETAVAAAARSSAIDEELSMAAHISTQMMRAEEAEAAKRTVEEKLYHAQMRLEELERVSAEALRSAEDARLAVERKWFEGVRPECRPSDQDISQMKARYHYNPGFFHIAVVGSAGAGKSSFINAVRGLSKQHPMAASTGIVETTETVTRYPDPSPISQMIWYDVPGAGTPEVPDWKYFNDMGLYIFDCIIMLTDNRVLDSDLAILRACEHFRNIESFVVRSKSDQYINNMVCERMPRGFDLGDPDMDDETRSFFLQTKSEERHRFINETCQNVRMHLERENLSPKKVYIVCMDAMLAIVNNSRSPKAINEAELLNDVKGCVGTRGYLGSGC